MSELDWIRGVAVTVLVAVLGRWGWHSIHRRLQRRDERRKTAEEFEDILTRISDTTPKEWPEAIRLFLGDVRGWKTRAGRSFPRGSRLVELCEEIETAVGLDICGPGVDDKQISTNVNGYLKIIELGRQVYEVACVDANTSPRPITTQVTRQYFERRRRGGGSSRVAGLCPRCGKAFECFQTPDIEQAREVICDQCQAQFPLSEIPEG